MLQHRSLDILKHGQEGKERALLEHDADAPLNIALRPAHILTENFHVSGVGLLKAKNSVQKDRLARSRAADHAQYFTTPDFEIKIVVNDLVTKCGAQTGHPDRERIGQTVVHGPAHRPSTMKITAKMASNMIMRKTDWTTADVT
ncbi:hypothetical protein SAMIE_1001330 [Sphingobium amiense]|uniref:Uncharacterized protein n=2 Tax=Sphingobium TaxID=165695 RepID=A0A1E1EY56_9SPHN|nr:hypothetical protein SCLO_1001400 [Sphingobium cloacae]BBD96632.1 hypothetical protein SAMIE_1001330 [Sphingobium amiense]